MKADALSPRQLFEGKMHYEIPPFQRPYVWNEEDQWAPLWADVTRVAESRVAGGGRAAQPCRTTSSALLSTSRSRPSSATSRVTTSSTGSSARRRCRCCIDAVAGRSSSSRGHEMQAEALEELILNVSPAFKGKPERFKLWPVPRRP